MKNYYRILQVENFAKDDIIKAAYRTLAKKYHPDLNKKVGPEIMAEINSAYDVLKDPIKKANFDRELKSRLSQEAARKAAAQEAARKTAAQEAARKAAAQEAARKAAAQEAARKAAAQEAARKAAAQEAARKAALDKRRQDTLRMENFISSVNALVKALVIGTICNMFLSDWVYLGAPRAILVYIIFGLVLGAIIKLNGGVSSEAVGFAGAFICLIILLIPHVQLPPYGGETISQVTAQALQSALYNVFTQGRYCAVSVILAPIATFCMARTEVA